MRRVNWFPEYWNYTEKNKLLDYWRYRYAKNLLIFSPTKAKSGGDGFFDASYESLKYFNLSEEARYEKVLSDFAQRKQKLSLEMVMSQDEDALRLALLLEAEQSAFDYWQIKALLRPSENESESMLINIVSLIDEKERLFKEAFSNLIEYDRRYFSPLSFPERNLVEQPVSVSDCFHWLSRGGRDLSLTDDVPFFEKNQKKIKVIKDQVAKLNEEYIPVFLSSRHKHSIIREKKQNIFRTSNGEELKGSLLSFVRPNKSALEQLSEQSGVSAKKTHLQDKFDYATLPLFEQIQLFKEFQIKQYESLNKLCLSNGLEISDLNTSKVIQNEEKRLEIFKSNLFGGKKKKDENIPKNPYIVLHQDLFNIIKEGKIEEQNELLAQLHSFLNQSVPPLENKPVFLLGSLHKLKEKFFKSEPLVDLSPENIQEIEVPSGSVTVINGGTLEEIDESVFSPLYEDEFDDTTRFKFFLKDKLGRFNRLKFLKKLLGKKSLLNRFRNIPQKLKTSSMVKELSQKLSKGFKRQTVEIKRDNVLQEQLKNIKEKNIKAPTVENKQELSIKQEPAKLTPFK